MTELLHEPTFFYAVALLLFVAAAFKYGRKPALEWIDGEIAKVRTELDEAQKLRAEAEAMLADTKAKQAKALADADAMLADAKIVSTNLKAQAEADLKAMLARHEQQAAERIRMAEAQAVADVRERVIAAAMQAARAALTGNLAGDAAAKLIDQAIADMPTATDSKAKAA